MLLKTQHGIRPTSSKYISPIISNLQIQNLQHIPWPPHPRHFLALRHLRLTRGNYLLWKAQVLPALRGAQMTSFLDGTKPVPSKLVAIPKEDETHGATPNPEYVAWLVKDQQVLSYLLNSLSKELEVLTQVVSIEHVGDLWTAIGAMFSSQSVSPAINLRIALANTKKKTMSAANFVSKMKGLGDEFAAVGRPFDEEEMVGYMLAGLVLDR